MALGMQDHSEIRDSELKELSNRVSKRSYGSYMLAMHLNKLRAYSGASIRFDFPVTALVGPNGGGKTTVLGAAALIFEAIPPRRFFAKSGKYDASMLNWKVEYELLERDSKNTVATRTASYRKSKWNRTGIKRPVLLFGVTRTIPASERTDLHSFIGGSFEGYSEQVLSEGTREAVQRILGKEAQRYLLVDASKMSDKKLYAATTPSGDAYSEFHFGAGEASVIRIVADIEKSPDESLILIEEIENGLHPVATKRLVEYLIGVARRKSCQVIFSTHSNDALAPLPDEAVWSCNNGTLAQGKLDVGALRTLTGQVQASFAIFVEDRFAEEMALAALRRYHRTMGVDLLGVAIHAVGGHGNAAKFARAHNDNPAISFRAMAILDGDMKDKVDQDKMIVAFPGDSDPELHVAISIASILDRVAAKIAVSFGLPVSEQTRVSEVIRSRMRTNHDPHVLFEQIGEDLDFTAGITVERTFLGLWAEEFPEEVEAIFAPVKAVMPRRSSKPQASLA
ncbi:ATP-binding protein [Arthrobacter zhaoxinii]|uniref:ATP-binding protein n=1 Tax=Arthrobacter zhaoxinii TaxID=2964616 RepID=A0ABY5YUJ7_9MICC|nr:ATP-binding protein [Arthrobacter zhaoxinii]UWX98465.1 ATP-binding protein [Arthrobacter zhaoxinii]